MRIAVLDFCVWLEDYQWDQKRFGPMVVDWVRRGLPDAALEVIDIGAGDPLPKPGSFDGYVLTGSEQGVYDDTPWMQPLRDWLVETRDAGKPIFGICFGHQIMADTFGGKAEKTGPAEVGVRSFDVDGVTVTGHVWHQDQVTKVPPGAEVIGSADYCPVAALAYEFPAMSVQFHPEYPPDYVSTFLRRSRGEVLSAEETDAAVAQFDASDVSPDLYAKELGKFFREALSAS